MHVCMYTFYIGIEGDKLQPSIYAPKSSAAGLTGLRVPRVARRAPRPADQPANQAARRPTKRPTDQPSD